MAKKKATKKRARKKRAKKARRPTKKKVSCRPKKKVRRIKVKVRKGLKPRAERVVRAEDGKLYHEIEYVAKDRFKKDAMTLGKEVATFKTVRPGKKKKAANPKRGDVRIIVGCLKEDFDSTSGLCLRTTAQKMVRRITTEEARRLQARNPGLLVVSNPTGVEAPGYSPRMVAKLGKTYKRFHFTNPSEAIEIWRPKNYPQGFMSIGECEMLKVKTPSGKTVTRRWKSGNRPHACTTSANKDVFVLIPANNRRLLKRGLRVPSGTAVRIDYKVPKTSGRNKHASRWYHNHDTAPKVVAHKSGKAVRITGPGLKVTPAGIEG